MQAGAVIRAIASMTPVASIGSVGSVAAIAIAVAGLSAAMPAAAASPSLAAVARDAASRPVIGQSPPPGARAAPGAADGRASAGDAAARADYLLHCSGCHGSDGEGHAIGRIPALRERIGRFLWRDEGRAFLVQVPGVNNTGLSDAAIAAVLNWLVAAWAADTRPPGFVPYRADEVARHRASRPADIVVFRRGLVARLAHDGQAVDGDAPGRTTPDPTGASRR